MINRIPNILRILGTLCLLSFVFPACSSSKATQKTYYDLVADFGAKNDNRTDAYYAFQQAAQTLSNRKNVVLNIPAGDYYIASYKIGGGSRKNAIRDVLFQNIDGLTIIGNNSTIRINGNFHRAGDYDLPGTKFEYAYNNTVSPFTFSNCKNLTLKNITLDGGVEKMTKSKNVVEGFCYGISISDVSPLHVSGNILIDSVEVKHFATDGMIIRSSGRNIRIENSRFANNARQGLSIVKGRDIFINNCSFDSTGYTGNYGGHSPQAGIDVENEYPIELLDNVQIKNSNFRHNNGFQFVATANSGRVVLDSCFFADTGNGYKNGFNGVGLYSKNSVLKNSIVMGMLQLETAAQKYRGDVPILIQNNIIYSAGSGLLSSDYNTNITIDGNVLVMLPNPIAGSYFPHIRNKNLQFTNNMIITHEDKISTIKNPYTALVQNVKKSQNNFWLLHSAAAKNAKPSSVKKDFYKIATDNAAEVGLQFVPELKTATAIRNERTLPSSVWSSILNYDFVTNYHQTKLNKSYLAEAAAMRQQMQTIISGRN